MAAQGTTQVPAGSVSTVLPIGDQVQEYEKILRISDEIFAGTHPRLKVPQQFVRKVPPRNPPRTPITPAQGARVEPSGAATDKPSQPESAPTGPASSQATTTTTSSVNGPPVAAPTTAPPSSRIVPKPTSEIDPIFLTKSDDLVRAEIQLQRQRVERVLREQIEQRRLESRQKASLLDAKPDFDVSDVLNKALEIVKPVGPGEAPGPNGTAVPSESLDENSFYSSRAPDSPQHREQQKPSPESERRAPPSASEDLATDVPVDQYSDELRRLEALNRGGSDQEMRDTYPVADQRLPYQKQAHNVQLDRLRPAQQQVDAALEEPEYSPPAPDVPPLARRDSREYHRGLANNARRRAPDRGYHPRRSLSPPSDVRIVRNHITSPAAPQPSRVSPLAIAKVPSAQQLRDPRPEYIRREPVSGHTSPDVAAQPLMPRKRRRVHDDRDRPVSYRRQAVDSSETYIKEEPVSPPPFADVPPIRTRPPHERPIYIDIASPRYTPVADRREPSIREPVYEFDPYPRVPEHDIHVEPTIPRAVSRVSTRRSMRDDQDLRRVASLQHARQPEIPREYIEHAPPPRTVRATSYAVVERPTQERARYYDESAPVYTRRYIPVDEAPVPPRYRETYVEGDLPPPPPIMAPPQRRIVIDEHGNQYYEAVHAPRIQPVPPRPASRVVKGGEIYDDRAPVHNASVRAPSIVEDAYGERRYVQEMPPPQVTYRRVTDYSRPVVISDRRAHAAAAPPLDDREPFPRSASVQVAEYPTRRTTTYVDEPGPPRERLVRMSSVRPVPARYDEPREVIQRVESVRPGGREVSVYVDDDARRPRGYVEQSVYVAAPRPMTRDERYYDNGDPDRMVLDGARSDVVQKVPQRY